MLPREVMGGLGLAVVWVNTLLVVLAAWRELSAIRARGRGFRALRAGEMGTGAIEGRVTRGEGTAGVIACRHVDQIGRRAEGDADRRAIAFADRSYGGASAGGAVSALGAEIRVAAAEEASVWPSENAVRAAASCPNAEAFDAAYALAQKARGFARRIEARIGEGERVWIRGELRREGDDLVLGAPEGDLLLVAAIDPRAWCRKKALFLAAFILGVLLAAAVCTSIALYPPHFGRVSTLGGALCLAYFLLVQPAGTAARDFVRPPSRAIVRGAWTG